jgi:hypothetical protein
MSMVEPTRYRPENDRPPEGVFLSADSGASWVVFAGTMIGLLSVLNMIYGIAAVSDSKVFVANTEFVYSGLNTWGWTLIAVSVVQAVTAVGLFAQVQIARWTGVAIAFVNAVIQTLMIPALPLWSLALFALDMLVIYGLIVHGAKEEE